MKRIVLSALAFSMLAATSLAGQAGSGPSVIFHTRVEAIAWLAGVNGKDDDAVRANVLASGSRDAPGLRPDAAEQA